jgi:bifunctional DNase/RNase
MPKMVEVVIDSVRVSLTNQQRIVVLREIDTERYLPIWIGPYEAESITIALQEIEVARPQTHDLLKNAITSLNGQLVRVEVVALREDVFYGNLVVDVNGQYLNIDSRPSDALALAVRTNVPVMVSQEVLDAAGIEPEQEMEDAPGEPESADVQMGVDNESEERLSVFEDFLSNLDIDDTPDSEEDDEDAEQGPADPSIG